MSSVFHRAPTYETDAYLRDVPRLRRGAAVGTRDEVHAIRARVVDYLDPVTHQGRARIETTLVSARVASDT